MVHEKNKTTSFKFKGAFLISSDKKKVKFGLFIASGLGVDVSNNNVFKILFSHNHIKMLM